MIALKNGDPKSIRQLSKDMGLTKSQIGNSLMIAWQRGLI
jgi:DNA-binding MarR family transcriptional regulator